LQIVDRDIKFIVRLFISKQFEAEASTPHSLDTERTSHF